MALESQQRYLLISTDGHAGADIADYKPYLEQKWHDDFEAWAASFEDGWRNVDHDGVDDKLGVSSFCSPINWQSEERQRNLEKEGIVAEVIFPNTVPPFYPSGVITAPGPRTALDYDQRLAGSRAHNRWLADFCAEVPGRRAGIAQLFLNDVDDAIRDVRWARDAGLMGVLLPGDHHLQLANLYPPALEPLWSVCEELDMPLHRHGNIVGEAANELSGVGAPALGMYEAWYFARRALPQLILAGVLERHPKLKFVFTELGADWVVPELQRLQDFCDHARDATSTVHAFAGGAAAALSKSMKDYFDQSCRLGTPLADADVQLRYEIGVDNIMWGADYPHHEGTAPHSLEALRANFAGVPTEEVEKMTSLNAAAVYGFDLKALRELSDQIGPTVAEVHRTLSPSEYPPHSACRSFGSYRPT